MANDLKVLFQFETDNIDQVESCVKSYMKLSKYRKYKEIYQTSLRIIKKAIKDCEFKIQEYNDENTKYNKKQKGGLLIDDITDDEIIYLLIPNENYN
jgi:hypothetical protein